MSKLPKWTERSDIKWRPVSEKPGNTGEILLASSNGAKITGPHEVERLIWSMDVVDYYGLWAWVCWDKT